MALCKNEKKQKEERRPLSHQSGPPRVQTTQEPQALVGLKVLALEETGGHLVMVRSLLACWAAIKATVRPRGIRSWGLGCRHLPLAGLWGCGCCKARPSASPSPSTCPVAAACPAPHA